MALTIEKRIDLTSYENNPAPKIVDQLSIIHEANDGEIVQYYLSSHKQGDKNSHAIGIPVEDGEGNLSYRYDNYDQLTWADPKHRIVENKRLDRLGVKAFPNVGAIAFYRLSYRNISRIVAPVNRRQTKTTAPTLAGRRNADGSTVTFTITPPTGTDAPSYKCYRIVMQNGAFGESHITYETTFTTPKPRVSGNYECYAIGYETEGQFCSEDSNSVFFDLIGNSDTYTDPTATGGGVMYGEDDPPERAKDGTIYVKVKKNVSVTLLDYVESNGTQYINTGYVHKSNTRIEITATVTNNTTSDWQVLFGARRVKYTNNAFVFFVNGDRGTVIWNRSGVITYGSKAFPWGVKTEVVADGKTVTVTPETGNSYSLTSTGTIDNGVCPMFIFETNTATTETGVTPDGADGSRVIAKLYRFKIYEGDTLVRDYCPALDADGNPGIYDTINGGFCKSAVSTPLVAGEVIGEKASYDIVSKSIRVNGTWVDAGYSNLTIDTRFETIDKAIKDQKKVIDKEIEDAKPVIDTELKDSQNPVTNAAIFAVLGNIETVMKNIIGGSN